MNGSSYDCYWTTVLIHFALTELNCTGPNPVRLDCTGPYIIFLNWDWTEITELVCSIVRRKVDYWTFDVNVGTHLSDLLRMMNLINLHTLKEIDHLSKAGKRQERLLKRIVAWERGEGGQWKYRRFWLKLTVIGLVCCAVWGFVPELNWTESEMLGLKPNWSLVKLSWIGLHCTVHSLSVTALHQKNHS